MTRDRQAGRLLAVLAPLAAASLALAILGGCGYTAAGEAGPATGPEAAPAASKPLVVAGYRVGSVHPDHVKTVYVQVFGSQEFRRELEFRITEALVKRILVDTPYKIAPRDRADTVLYGELTSVPVTLLGSDFDSDLPRENQLVLVCNWTWKDRRTGEVLAQRRGMQQSAEFIPLAGETFFDGSEEGINDLAQRIVEGMEADW